MGHSWGKIDHYGFVPFSYICPSFNKKTIRVSMITVNKKWLRLIGIVGCTVWMASCKQAGVKPSFAIMEVKAADKELSTSYSATIRGRQDIDIYPQVSGTIEKLCVTEGQTVRRGQLLFVIEPSQYEDAVEQAEAALKTAQAQYDYAENNYTRMKEAAQSDAISTIDLIQAESKLEQSRASVRNAEAALSTARIQLGYCYVKAPFEGRISRNLYDVGNYISGSLQSTKLATIYQDKKMYAYFNIEDNQYLKMLLNQSKGKHSVPSDRVEILFQEPTSRSYYGRLDYLSPNVDLSTGTLSIRAEVDNPAGELKSGLYISAVW
mgnify:CR=1 FL=1